MVNLFIKAALLVTGLTVFGYATAGGQGLSEPTPPVVLKTVVDFKKNILVISGRHFGTATPTVKLADDVLDVQHFSENEIVANLPRTIQVATYGLTVTSGSRHRSASNLFGVLTKARLICLRLLVTGSGEDVTTYLMESG